MGFVKQEGGKRGNGCQDYTERLKDHDHKNQYCMGLNDLLLYENSVKLQFPVLIFSVDIFIRLDSRLYQVLRSCECHEICRAVLSWPTFRQIRKI